MRDLFIRNDLICTGVIKDAALADHSTLYGGDTDARFKWQGKSSNNEISIAHRNVSTEYIALQIYGLLMGTISVKMPHQKIQTLSLMNQCRK